MIKKLAFCFIGIMIFTATSAWAAGIGVYGTGGINLSTWQSHGVSTETNDYFYGGGIVIDSNVAKNELFNYRFAGGYEQYVLTVPRGSYFSGTSSEPINRISMSHTFGFGVARNNEIRFWLGPQIGLHYLLKHDNDYKLDFIGLDTLLALGLNVNAGDAFTFFFSIGFGYMGNYNLNVSETENGFGVDGKIGFMFRINDTFATAINK